MTIFIPPFLGQDVKSNAERKIYALLQKMDIKNAVVLHSLGLPKHEAKIYGEIDFVVVCERGVICLEIKGGRVEHRDGQWIFIDRYGVEHRKAEGPFQQVIGNMFSLKKLLQNQFKTNPHGKNLLVASGVMFPDVIFNSHSQEIISEIVFDAATDDVSDYLTKAFNYWESRQHHTPSKLPESFILQIVNYLRSSFTFIPKVGTQLEQMDAEFIRLTHAQSMIIEGLQQNERLLINGSAGTGKTLLAVHYAKICADQKQKVLFVTFNKNLVHILQQHFKENAFVKVVNLHALYGELVEVNRELLQSDPSKYFSQILPQEVYDSLVQLGKESQEYDVLVVDEGQDLLTTENLLNLDLLLKNGLEKGKWAIFYDGYQNIYNPEFEDGLVQLKSYHHTMFSLLENCRNTLSISQYAEKVSGISVGKHQLNVSNVGDPVQELYYVDDKDYSKKLTDLLKFFKKENIALSDVVFLAPKRYEKTSLARIGFEVTTIFDDSNALPKFSTLQGFKGLESRVVVLCDVEDIFDYNYSTYMYLCATRARGLLYVITRQNSSDNTKDGVIMD